MSGDYARSMPALGFDPAPGDVGLTRHLAKQYGQVVTELNTAHSMVKGIDTSKWTGQAAIAFRTLLETIPPAIAQTITTAKDLQSAASSWAGKLAGFQSEADTLERQAAAAAAAAKPPAPATGGHTPQPDGGSAGDGDPSDPSSLAAIKKKAHELNSRYLEAARKTAEEVPEDPGLWEKTEPIRKVLEAVLAPLDIVAADHWIDWLKDAAGVPAGWLKELDEQIEGIESLPKGSRAAALIDAAKMADRIGAKWDAWDAFAPRWLKLAAGNLAGIKGLSYGLGGLGILADAGTIISPQDSGAMGWVDRGAAGVNGVLLGVNMFTDEIPVVGEVTLAATGIYLAGDFLYHHWKPFHDVANDVGHATVDAAKAVGHAASSAWHTVSSWF